MMAVQGVVWLLAIQAVCALAVLVWHRRHKHPDSWLVVVLCPIIAIVGQVFAIYLLFANIDTLAGTIGYVDLIGPIALIGVAIGLGYAFCAEVDQPQEVRHDRPHDRRGRDRGARQGDHAGLGRRAGGVQRRLQLPAQRRALHEHAVERGGADREGPGARGLERADALQGVDRAGADDRQVGRADDGADERLDVLVVAVGEQVDAVDAELGGALRVGDDLVDRAAQQAGWPTIWPT